MTEPDWLAGKKPAAMWGHLRTAGLPERKQRLFGCAYCRRLWWDRYPPEERQALEVAEAHAEGRASAAEVERAWEGVNRERGSRTLYAWDMALEWTLTGSEYTWNFMNDWGWGSGAEPDERQATAELLHEIFGNPFRPVRVSSAVRAWEGGKVVQLARGIREDRAFDRLPILGDALEEAGCDAVALLEHCRAPGPHVPGCWAVDLLTE